MCADTTADVVIIGSGMAGALIAKELGRAGKKVLILEAGAELPADTNGYMRTFYNAYFKVPEIPYPPDVFTPTSSSDLNDLTDPGTVNAGRPTVMSLLPTNWQDPAKSYLIQKGPLPFASTYERINGGTSRHWLGTSLRNVPNDFVMRDKYGVFVDWPLRYDGSADKSLNLKQWYTKAERAIGVSADVADQTYLGVTFDQPYPMPKIPLSYLDTKLSEGLKGFSQDGTELKVRSTPAARNSQPYQDRRVCAGNTNCIPICPIQAKYDPSVTLAEAFRTGNVDILYRTVASDIVVGENGRVGGIKFVRYREDKGPRTEEGTAVGKLYVIAGNAIETPRLLLMSMNRKGVANSSGLVGKNLMDHPLYLAWALMPADKPVYPYRGPLSTAGIEDLRDGPFRKQRGAFRIEIGNEGWNFPIGDPQRTTMDFINGLNQSGLNSGSGGKPGPAVWGPQLVENLNRVLPRQFRLAFLIEQEPEESNRVALADAKDGLDLPRPEIHYDLSPYTRRGMAAAKRLATAIFNKLGATEFTQPAPGAPSEFPSPDNPAERIQFYGAGHLVGTYRMGTDKWKSVVDADQKAWDHDNLYLVGCGTFPTVATANPTLTLAALSLRTVDHIVKKVLN
jgi:choline dehydrogenase-like flavoprotein